MGDIFNAIIVTPFVNVLMFIYNLIGQNFRDRDHFIHDPRTPDHLAVAGAADQRRQGDDRSTKR